VFHWPRLINLVGLVVSAAMAAACAESSDTYRSTSSASLKIAFSSTFSGASVRICGEREPPDSRTTCISELPDDPCTCYNFDADGRIVDENGVPVVLMNLCPSTGSRPGEWTFEYEVYGAPDCEGTQLNAATNDFACYDIDDLETRANPNTSTEALNPGLNVNRVVCVVETAAKTWGFTDCTDITTEEDAAAGITRSDCDCAPVEGVCMCEAGLGIGPDDLQPGCSFDDACNIACQDNALLEPFACDDTIYVVAGVPDGGRRVFSMDQENGVLEPIAANWPGDFEFNAIGFNPVDGFLYAVTSRPSPPAVIRIGRNGAVRNLGAVAALAGTTWVEGDFRSDGSYVVANVDDDWKILEVGTTLRPFSVASGEWRERENPSGWAVNPADGMLFGYDPERAEVCRFQPEEGTTVCVHYEALANQIGDRDCVVAFTEPDVMLLGCRTRDPNVGQLYSVIVNRIDPPPEPQLIARVDAEGPLLDMTACAFPD
jgi:hypothetical protein